jgi:hypothetical protein
MDLSFTTRPTLPEDRKLSDEAREGLEQQRGETPRYWPLKKMPVSSRSAHFTIR